MNHNATSLEEIDKNFILNTIPTYKTKIKKGLVHGSDYSNIVKIPDEHLEQIKIQTDMLMNNGFVSNEINMLFQEYINLSIENIEFNCKTIEIQKEYNDFSSTPVNTKIAIEPFDPVSFHISEMEKNANKLPKTIDKFLNIKIKKKVKRIYIPEQKNII